MYFKGSMVALVTPMNHDGSVDTKALSELVDWHLEAKTDAIIAVGTTGESATLNSPEQAAVISHIIKQVAGRVPVIAGTGSNSTEITIHHTQAAKALGADACLVVTPYYNKPTQKGLYQHYKAITEQVDIPLILYNVPGRTACDLLPETVEQLAEIKNIIGIKEATGQLTRAQDILKRCHPEFELYSGDDATALSLMQHGAKGVISVTANIAPAQMHALCEAVRSGRMEEASSINDKLKRLHQDLFLESNPIPAKWALSLMKKIQPYLRLPLTQLDASYHQQLKEAMQHAGVLA